MKALIVEDELLARLGMRSLIDWTSMGIELLEDAADGRDALTRIEEDQPDLILLDLNIPEITGLELMRIIRKRNLPIKVIVVSCYEDFETVKEAMKLGAVDYIRKFGLSREELTTSLQNVLQTPIGIPEQVQRSVGQIGRKTREELQHIPEPYQSGYVLSCYMLWKYSEEMTDMRIVETVASQFYQQLGQNPMSILYEGKLLLFLQRETTIQEVERLHKMISHFVTNRCYIGITPYVNRDGEDGFFMRLAGSIEAYGFYDCGHEIIELEAPIEIRKAFPFDVAAYMEPLEAALAKVSHKDMQDVLAALLDVIVAYPDLSVNLVKKLMVEILSRFSDKAGQLGGSIEEIEVSDSNKHYHKIVNMASYEELRHWWDEFLVQFTHRFFTSQKKSESDIIQMALTYIEQNLDKPILLSDVARYIGVSEPYLSSFFKNSLNENFIPYVNRQKMKRAKQLLAEGKLVYQVSELLGYENTTYFSKVFKRVEGITPEQYRKGAHSV